MVDLLYRAIYWVAEMHDHILNINNVPNAFLEIEEIKERQNNYN